MNRPLERAKAAGRIACTVGILLTTPLWLPVCFLIYEVNWRGMWADLRRFHEAVWRE